MVTVKYLISRPENVVYGTTAGNSSHIFPVKQENSEHKSNLSYSRVTISHMATNLQEGRN